MANRFANLVGTNKIKDEWPKINTGFDKVQQELDAHLADYAANAAKTKTANTFTQVQTFNGSAHFKGDFPLHMFGKTTDTEGKRNYRFDIVQDYITLQAIGEDLTYVRQMVRFDHDGTFVMFSGIRISWGNGSPEGVLTGGVGDMYLRRDGGATTTLYVKTSGSGNTGWTAK